jgi:uncharacterized membrane protein
MTQHMSGYTAPAGSPTDPSTTQVAHDQAAQVGRTTSDAGKRVAGTAADQAGQVADEARRQARDLLGEARGQAMEQARNGQQKASEGLRTLATELHQMADNGDQHGPASDLAKQAAEKIEAIAEWLSRREPGELVDEFRAMARRRPGAFLIGAATAGVLAGRLTRGAVDANRDTSPPRPIAAEPVTAPLLPAAGAPVYPSGPPPAYPPSAAYAPPAPHGYSPGPGAGPPPITEPRPYAPDVPVDPEAWGEPGPGSAHAPRPGTTAGAEYGQEFGRPGTPRDDDPLQPGGFR